MTDAYATVETDISMATCSHMLDTCVCVCVIHSEPLPKPVQTYIGVHMVQVHAMDRESFPLLKGMDRTVIAV